MKIFLEHISDSQIPHTFRVAFHSSSQRYLLPYTEVTGLNFSDAHGKQVAEWGARTLMTKPLDDFVLTPRARIAFDLYANINNSGSDIERWNIELQPGRYQVHYLYKVSRDTEWYDFLQKRSRFVEITPIWQGTVRSNTIEFELPG